MRSLLFLVVPAIIAGTFAATVGYFATNPGGVFSPAFLALIFGATAFIGVFLIFAGLLTLSWLWGIL